MSSFPTVIWNMFWWWEFSSRSLVIFLLPSLFFSLFRGLEFFSTEFFHRSQNIHTIHNISLSPESVGRMGETQTEALRYDFDNEYQTSFDPSIARNSFDALVTTTGRTWYIEHALDFTTPTEKDIINSDWVVAMTNDDISLGGLSTLGKRMENNHTFTDADTREIAECALAGALHFGRSLAAVWLVSRYRICSARIDSISRDVEIVGSHPSIAMSAEALQRAYDAVDAPLVAKFNWRDG